MITTALKKIFGSRNDRELKRIGKMVQSINELEASYDALSDDDLRAKTEEFRGRITAGASLAVTKIEQGQIGGIVASINGACYIFAPALGVWLYGHHEAIGFTTLASLCAIVFVLGWRRLDRDEVLVRERR